MKVSDLFTKLALGELSSLGMVENQSIKSASQSKIIHHANEALTRLYSRFVILEKELLIEMVDGITVYHLLHRFSESNCDRDCEDDPYIKDAADPFMDDLIRVLRVVDECGIELALNDDNNPESLFTPTTHSLQVPQPVPGQTLSVVYQAHHPRLEFGVKGAVIDVPLSLEKALTAYIAGQVYSSMNGPENSAKGAEHMATYERVCQEVIDRDSLNNTISTSNDKFYDRGFV